MSALPTPPPPDKIQQYAWLSANLKLKNAPKARGPLNACAWDKDFYYYIAFFPPYPPTPRERLLESPALQEARKVKGVYAVPISSEQALVLQSNGRAPQGLQPISLP